MHFSRRVQVFLANMPIMKRLAPSAVFRERGAPFLLLEVSSGALSGLPYYVGITLLATEKDMK